MDLFTSIKEELLFDLPGRAAQEKLAPKHSRTISSDNPKQDAAVSLIILSGKEKTELVFTKRSEYDGHHSRQVCFPGGKTERTDSSLVETAIRETREETGIRLSAKNCLGKLTPLHIPVSNFLVHPFIFSHRHMNKTDFQLDKQEVDYLILFSLKDLFRNNLVQIKKLKIKNFGEITTPYYSIKNETVWGATAMILSEFVEILNRTRKKHPEHFK
jgi:8-oxo-dGTP pyrophosphatase MutT (NUDIX family)